jgi:hypothetical protein
MDLANRLSILQTRADEQRAALDHQKKAETALVLPFFDALGYDLFDVRAVEPEVNVGKDGGETVEYALKREDRPVVLVECEGETASAEVPDDHTLFRHAEAMDVPLVLFTDGLRNRFYAVVADEDERPGEPLLDLDLLDYTSEDVDLLRQFTRPVFDRAAVRTIRGHARNRQVREYLAQQKEAPDAPFVQFVATQICDGNVPDGELDRFRPAVQNVLDELLREPEPGRRSPAAREEAPVPPAEEGTEKQQEPGVFGKDVVKRALNDL